MVLLGILVKEVYDKVVEVRRVNDRVKSLAIVCEEEVVKIVCAHVPQSGKLVEEKEFFNEDLSREWTTHHTVELIIGMGDINGYVGRHIGGFPGVHGGIEWKREGCYQNFVMQSTFALPTYGIDCMTRRR